MCLQTFVHFPLNRAASIKYATQASKLVSLWVGTATSNFPELHFDLFLFQKPTNKPYVNVPLFCSTRTSDTLGLTTVQS